MKRFITILLAVFILFPLLGCSNGISEYANFYYCSVDYPFGENSSVIKSESRNISGHEGELSYLISLYLTGPSDKNLSSLFPKNTKLITAQINEDKQAEIELSYLGNHFSDSEFVLACACLSLSVMDFSDAEQVSITSGEKNITMSKDDLLLFDTVTTVSETEASE